MILGGSLWKGAIKQFCEEYGVKIIAAGNDPSSGMCDIADEYYNVNSTDSVAMKELIIEKKIDGVYLGGNEPVISAACQYVNELGLPCYCTKKQWDALQNKSCFKDLCVQFELPVTRRFDIDLVSDSDYPVITKPADGCGSRGFSVCRNRTELNKAYAFAQECSPTRTAIIEQFVPNDGIVVYYTVSNGKLIFSAMADKFPVVFEPYGTYVGGFFEYQSEQKNEFSKLFKEKLQRLVDYLGIREGNFWVEVFHSESRYYFNEAGFRYGGEGSPYPVNYFSGINQVATDIYYSLSGKSKIKGFIELYGDNIQKKSKYGIYPVFLKPGKIKSITGCEELLDDGNILNILHMKKEENTIPENGSFNQVVLLIHFVFHDNDELERIIAGIHRHLKVKDENNQNMIIQLFDIDRKQ